ncbi:class I SAM-dependent methyltransferase [Marinigracilibium pacificum]|uniref:Class I SAM-dependent methyltransferase n=1 Tax=Marinigracilibium pacificum TaxID=2729599 RepID=A0A848IXK1_9BACT|nr:class I SAM-dependent methyltransferase [Marinigracilibium pacificum]NMM47000.1 class I SAM-dependent methyltransferase [Marinigracilibium pacificum]
MNKIDIQNCPICGHSSFIEIFECKDNTVTGELFKLKECANCNFRITSPRPEDKDLGKYYKSDQYISHSDSDEGLINKIYKRVRNLNLKIKYNLVKKNTKASDINLLDVGSGTGYFVNYCNNNGIHAEGYEPDNDARNKASELHNIKLYNSWGDIHKTYEVITMWHVLEHVPDLNEEMTRLKNLLTPNGILIIAVPNRESYDEKIYKQEWAAYDVPRHLYHFRKQDIISLAKKYKLSFIEDKPMWFDAPYVSMLSEDHKRSSLPKLKGLTIGTISNLSSIFTKQQSSKIYIFENEN